MSSVAVGGELTVLERVRAFARRKQLYEARFPETRHGGAPGKPAGGKRAKDDKVTSFASNTATKAGTNRRLVELDVSLARRLPEELDELLAGTPIEDDRSELERLAELPEEEQRAVAPTREPGRAAGDLDA